MAWPVLSVSSFYYLFDVLLYHFPRAPDPPGCRGALRSRAPMPYAEGDKAPRSPLRIQEPRVVTRLAHSPEQAAVVQYARNLLQAAEDLVRWVDRDLQVGRASGQQR